MNIKDRRHDVRDTLAGRPGRLGHTWRYQDPAGVVHYAGAIEPLTEGRSRFTLCERANGPWSSSPIPRDMYHHLDLTPCDAPFTTCLQCLAMSEVRRRYWQPDELAP